MNPKMRKGFRFIPLLSMAILLQCCCCFLPIGYRAALDAPTTQPIIQQVETTLANFRQEVNEFARFDFISHR